MVYIYIDVCMCMYIIDTEDDAVKQVQNTFDFLSNEDSDDEDDEELEEWQQSATKVCVYERGREKGREMRGMETEREMRGIETGSVRTKRETVCN